jgi:hypothetical protein
MNEQDIIIAHLKAQVIIEACRAETILKCTSMQDITTVLQERVSRNMVKELQTLIDYAEHSRKIENFIHGKTP